MKTSTIHTNPMGDVLNVTSATGFRIEESPGRVVELRSETGRALLHVGRHVVTVQFIADMLEQQERAAMKTCYECGKPAMWLAPDSRCSDCTRLTPDQVRGS